MKKKFALVIVIATMVFTSHAQDTWTQKNDIGYNSPNVTVPNQRYEAAGFSIAGKGYIGTGFDGQHKYNDLWEYDPTTDIWTQKADFGGSKRFYAVGFSIGSKGYIGTGTDDHHRYADFWEYDPSTNSWTQKASFPGSERFQAVGFSISNKGYIGTGFDTDYRQDFWEYDPLTDTWVRKTDFGGHARCAAVGFSISNEGYLGTGFYYDNTDHSLADFWQYDPSSDKWVQKADFGGPVRYFAVGFSVGSQGYIGTGYNYYLNFTSYKDFWAYDPSTNSWTQKADFGGEARTSATGFSIGSKGYLGTGTYTDKDFWEYDPATDVWTRKADFGGNQRSGAVGFSIAGIGYLGTGVVAVNGELTDFWQYDPNNGSWSQKADFGGSARELAVGFSISSKGYIGTGQTFGVQSLGDFWEYDPSQNTWTKKADFGGQPRYGAVGFAIGTKGYIGTGSLYTNDFWEYNPTTNVWTQKADFKGSARQNAVGFAINGKGYIGTGISINGVYTKDFWQYDPVTNTWTQKEDFGGTPRYLDLGFSIGSKGYIGTGSDNTFNVVDDFWEYDPAADQWTQKNDFAGGKRTLAVGFAIGSKGYVGSGTSKSNDDLKDFWEYTPDDFCTTCPLPENVYVSDITNTTAVVYWTGNDCAVSYRIRKRPVGTTTWQYSHVDAPDTSKKLTNNISGTQYEVQVQTYCDAAKTDSSGYTASVYFTAGCAGPVITSVTASANPICKGDNTNLTVVGTLNGATSWQWYTVSCGGNSAGSGTSIPVSPATTTTYYVRGEGGCVIAGACSSITVTVNNTPKAKITALGSLDICATGFVDLQASSGNGYSYKWMLNGSKINGATNQVYHATQVGDYTVKVTNAKGCTKKSEATTVYSSCRSAALKSDAIKIYPNPAGDETIIQFSLEQSSHVRLSVYDVHGEEIKTLLDNVMQSGDHSLLLNLSHFAKGGYTVRLITDDRTENQKLIVQ